MLLHTYQQDIYVLLCNNLVHLNNHYILVAFVYIFQYNSIVDLLLQSFYFY